MGNKQLIRAILFIVFSTLLILTLSKYIQRGHYNHHLNVGGRIVYVDIAQSSQEMEQGLSGRTKMAANQGMMFSFAQSSQQFPNFWMKDMNFGLDFIWIKNNTVIEITPNIPAPKNKEGKLLFYKPSSPIDSVLEVNAGYTQKNNIKIGDLVQP